MYGLTSNRRHPKRSSTLCRSFPFLGVILLMHTLSFCQKANTWYFGDFAGLNFTESGAVGIQNNTVMQSANGCAVLCDDNGEMLLFSNGETVWDKNNQVIPNGDSLAGNNTATQNALFVPAPGHPGKFYLFTQDRTAPIGQNGLCYTVIEIFNDTYRIREKNVSLFPESSEKLTAILHTNQVDFWVICHEYNSDHWHSYLLTEDGVHTDPVISATGTIQTSSSMTDLPVGAMKASPDGKLLAGGFYDKDVFELYDFDAQTGTLSNARTSRNLYKGAYSVEFSADGTKLYGSTYFVTGGTNTSYLFQFNLTGMQNLHSVSVIPSSSDFPFRATSLQLGPDGKIYVARNDADSLGIIYNPERTGPDCNFTENAISLEGRICREGLPSFLSHYAKIPLIQYSESCFGDTTWFSLTNTAFIDSLQWDFTDIGHPARFDTALAPYHIFSYPDTFHINLSIYFNGTQHKFTQNVIIRPLPRPALGENFYLLSGTETILSPGSGFTSYLWDNQSQKPERIIFDAGNYFVKVQDQYGCENSDTVRVTIANIQFPTAFTPNNDGLNDLFFPYVPDQGFQGYRLLIFNRYGELVFESLSPDEGWDGTNKGIPCPGGVYIYRVLLECKNCNSREARQKFTGSIMLLK
ncbi:MAG: gliding motility-associated C-terminal domain-containing protein [Bacteroidales bacterium]|nr:gliding motility-associated C-terminal domain-containing protein [Bacteroidales bacterium]MDD3960269.1 gliding motility-associated C-terminal domain-containing protein [Bacteroidales bacterium]HPE86392.1 gliding motility-associated C-terminal domain-containing protein [Bacteroidales bacterium]